MRRQHLVMGHFAGMVSFGAAIWIGFGLREAATGAPPHLDALSGGEFVQAIAILHGASQALLWQYGLMTFFTILGVLLSGITQIAWWRAADLPPQQAGVAPGRVLHRSSPRATAIWICGKRYLLR